MRPLTLPARYYTDAEVFRSELERFYFDGWIPAGREDRIQRPGDYFLVDVAGESVIVTRGESDRVRAFFNVCRHRGTRMCTAPEGGFPGRIRCPYHGWTYGLDGGLLGAPHMEESGFNRADYPLRALHVGLWDGHIFIHFGSAAPPLGDPLGGLPRKCAPLALHQPPIPRRLPYHVEAHLKLIL